MSNIKTTYSDGLINELSYNNQRAILLVIDKGWTPFIDIIDALINTHGFELVNQYGLTDMHASFKFKGVDFELEYFSMDEMISLIAYTDDEAILKEYRNVAKELAKKYK